MYLELACKIHALFFALVIPTYASLLSSSKPSLSFSSIDFLLGKISSSQPGKKILSNSKPFAA